MRLGVTQLLGEGRGAAVGLFDSMKGSKKNGMLTRQTG